jgi:hypothetical protein
MKPISTLQAVVAAIVALVLGVVAGAIPAYLIGKGDGKAEKSEQVGALKTSVDSCTDAAKKAGEVSEAQKKDGDEREARIVAAIQAQTIEDRKALARIAQIAAYKARGSSECEQLQNAVDDLFRGVRP